MPFWISYTIEEIKEARLDEEKTACGIVGTDSRTDGMQ